MGYLTGIIRDARRSGGHRHGNDSAGPPGLSHGGHGHGKTKPPVSNNAVGQMVGGRNIREEAEFIQQDSIPVSDPGSRKTRVHQEVESAATSRKVETKVTLAGSESIGGSASTAKAEHVAATGPSGHNPGSEVAGRPKPPVKHRQPDQPKRSGANLIAEDKIESIGRTSPPVKEGGTEKTSGNSRAGDGQKAQVQPADTPIPPAQLSGIRDALPRQHSPNDAEDWPETNAATPVRVQGRTASRSETSPDQAILPTRPMARETAEGSSSTVASEHAIEGVSAPSQATLSENIAVQPAMQETQMPVDDSEEMLDTSGLSAPESVSMGVITRPVQEEAPAFMPEQPRFSGESQQSVSRQEENSPSVHIGRVDVFVVSHPESKPTTSSHDSQPGFASRRYLRRL